MLKVFSVRSGEQIAGKLSWVKKLNTSSQLQFDHFFSPDENSPTKLDVVIHNFLEKLCLLLKCHPSFHVAYRAIPF